jgi:hypothetical protein
MPLEVFYSYAHEDEKLRDEIEKGLSLLRRNGLIVDWHDRRVGAGGKWGDEIDAHVRSAHIILLLISADFLASDYCYGVEMKVALERHARHEAIVIPIILRPLDWSGAPFADLKALPRDAKAVTSWPNQDEAFADIARGIREVVQRFQSPAGGTATSPGIPAGGLKDRYVPKSRMLDAALPSHVVKDRATELLVLIRLPESPGLAGTLLVDEDAEAKPEDVRSKPFNVIFPLGLDGRPDPLKVTVQLTSPDFSPEVQRKNLFVPPDEDSELCRFLLTPVRTGKLRVLVELQWEDALRGSRSLKTECVAEAESVPASSAMNVVRMEVNVGVGPAGERRPAETDATSAPPGPPAQAAAGPYSRSEYSRMVERDRLHAAERDMAMRSGARNDNYKQSDHDGYRQSTPPQASWEGPVLRSPVPLPKKRRSGMPAILVAVIGAISAITVGYWQYGASNKGSLPVSHQEMVLRWHVMSAQTKEFVPDARVTVELDSGGSFEKFTDSSGKISVDLGDAKPNAHGRLYVRAEGYQTLEKDFVVNTSTANEELRLEPMKSTTPPPKLGSNMIAGRVVDSSTSAGVSHASISLAGRTETYLTDDNGNFRIRLSAPFPNEGVRLQVKKGGCAPLDQVVRPAAESLALELNCPRATVR